MHGLETIKALNKAAATRATKNARPDTLTRAANGRERFPTAAELTADRRAIGHGDPLTAAHNAAKERPAGVNVLGSDDPNSPDPSIYNSVLEADYLDCGGRLTGGEFPSDENMEAYLEGYRIGFGRGVDRF